ncbi:MAG: FAD-binding oxidoreductase [Corynebacteriales bacterium]|nr:FAD-binding oxidoreductase [Mycobacteriales bacterium]
MVSTPEDAPRAAHEAAVAELRQSYLYAEAARPPGETIRLAKPTSNLFRFGERHGVGLDVSAFTKVLNVDPAAGIADVQGMTTYETLVDATLAHGLMPTVVPQLKTITLGGAVTGLGIESTSLRNGLPHEAVQEMEILTGSGAVITANAKDHSDLFHGFPNSYGTLGYALRLQISLEEVKPYVRLRHHRFGSAEECATAISHYAEHPPDFIDGTLFSPNEMYLTVGDFVDKAGDIVSDYTGQNIYYKSIQERSLDFLTIRDYLWRWDTDWFWCSRAFGVQNPLVRTLWPNRLLRSDVYHRLVRLDRRWQLSHRLDKLRGRPEVEPVIQDVEIPIAKLPYFLAEFQREVGITPLWLCPVRAQQNWPLYPLKAGELYVNVGFWSAVPRKDDPDHHNLFVEELVADCGGHKSLYSTVHYGADEFWSRYHGDQYWPLKHRYDPDGVLPDLYSKCVAK